ncbi:SulP family inorganic anion transporter [Streptomyces citrinus]|uniref:SulP family inorganic anion transporter n=1 Tax=Streptomyces citrinus TaxID=3118173 RepID=UPI003CC68D8B
MFARTALMVTTLTSAIALSSRSVLTAAGLDPGDLGALAALTVLVGVIMLAMGLLKLGSVLSFVSTAVMTGFTTGITLQIVTGVLKDATGYTPTPHNTLAKVVDSLVHIGDGDGTTVLVAVATLAAWAAFRAVRRLESYATLLALLAVTLVCLITGRTWNWSRTSRRSPARCRRAPCPTSNPFPNLRQAPSPSRWSRSPRPPGSAPPVANPDGTRPDASRDFTAQGLANIAGGFFPALPTGGSLSPTGLGTSAGAQSRWSRIFAGV